MRGFFEHHRTMETVRVLRLLRLALSGAIAGAAIAGLLSPTVGGSPEHASAFGAAGGFVVVAVIKLAHLI